MQAVELETVLPESRVAQHGHQQLLPMNSGKAEVDGIGLGPTGGRGWMRSARGSVGQEQPISHVSRARLNIGGNQVIVP